MIPKIREGKISELKPDDINANRGTARGEEMLENSLATYGAARSVFTDKNLNLLGGNKTANAYAAIGGEDVIIVPSDGKKLVVVQRTDLDINSPEARELAIADNRTGEINLDWDGEALLRMAEEGVNAEGFFEPDEWADITGAFMEPDTPGVKEGKKDSIPSTSTARCQKGDLWKIGNHWLYCGDATSPYDIAKLMRGEKVRIVYAHPPSGKDFVVQRVPKSTAKRITAKDVTPYAYDEEVAHHAARDSGTALSDALYAISCYMLPGGVCYIQSATGHALYYHLHALFHSPFLFQQTITWVKPHSVLAGGGDFADRSEALLAAELPGGSKKAPPIEVVEGNGQTLLLYGWAEGGNRFFADDFTATTVIEDVARPETSANAPDATPVDLIVKCLRYSTVPGDIIWDGFAGTGASIIACQQEGRRCYAMEIMPSRCDTILTRYEEATEDTPILVKREGANEQQG